MDLQRHRHRDSRMRAIWRERSQLSSGFGILRPVPVSVSLNIPGRSYLIAAELEPVGAGPSCVSGSCRPLPSKIRFKIRPATDGCWVTNRPNEIAFQIRSRPTCSSAVRTDSGARDKPRCLWKGGSNLLSTYKVTYGAAPPPSGPFRQRQQRPRKFRQHSRTSLLPIDFDRGIDNRRWRIVGSTITRSKNRISLTREAYRR